MTNRNGNFYKNYRDFAAELILIEKPNEKDKKKKQTQNETCGYNGQAKMPFAVCVCVYVVKVSVFGGEV